MSRRTLILIAAVTVLAAATLVLIGCDRSRAQADEAFATASEQIERYNASDARVAELMRQADATSDDASGAVRALGLLEEAESELKVGRKAIAAARHQFLTVIDLRVGEDIKRYARMQLGIADLMLRADSTNGELIDSMRELFELVAEDGMEGKALDRLIDAGDSLDAELEVLAREIETRQQAADAFFDQADLGK